MSSTILHSLEQAPDPASGPRPEAASPESSADEKNPALLALGERVRNLRARQGMTRKAVALAADVSERHLANLEYGIGNASILVLLQVAGALQCSLAELNKYWEAVKKQERKQRSAVKGQRSEIKKTDL